MINVSLGDETSLKLWAKAIDRVIEHKKEVLIENLSQIAAAIRERAET